MTAHDHDYKAGNVVELAYDCMVGNTSCEKGDRFVVLAKDDNPDYFRLVSIGNPEFKPTSYINDRFRLVPPTAPAATLPVDNPQDVFRPGDLVQFVHDAVTPSATFKRGETAVIEDLPISPDHVLIRSQKAAYSCGISRHILKLIHRPTRTFDKGNLVLRHPCSYNYRGVMLPGFGDVCRVVNLLPNGRYNIQRANEIDKYYSNVPAGCLVPAPAAQRPVTLDGVHVSPTPPAQMMSTLGCATPVCIPPPSIIMTSPPTDESVGEKQGERREVKSQRRSSFILVSAQPLYVPPFTASQDTAGYYPHEEIVETVKSVMGESPLSPTPVSGRMKSAMRALKALLPYAAGAAVPLVGYAMCRLPAPWDGFCLILSASFAGTWLSDNVGACFEKGA